MDGKLPNKVTAIPSPAPAKERQAQPLAELAAAQGIAGPQDFDALLGAGSDLWDHDADFEAFLEDLREARRTGG